MNNNIKYWGLGCGKLTSNFDVELVYFEYSKTCNVYKLSLK